MRKLLKAMKRSLSTLFIVVPLTFGILIIFSGLYHFDFITLVITKPYSYAFWSGLPLAFILGIFLNYDLENQI